MQPVLVTTTCEKEADAIAIGRAIVERKLAACVQICPPVTSIYRWEGEIASEREHLVWAKSEITLFAELCQVIRAMHPYDVPEIIATEIVAVDEDYQRWLEESLDHGR